MIRTFRDMTEYCKYINNIVDKMDEETFIEETYLPYSIDRDFPRNTLATTIKTLKYCGLYEQAFTERTRKLIEKYKLLLEG